MKNLIKIFSLIIATLLIAACSDNDSVRKFGGRTWSQSLSADDQALERAIVADVMGGMLAEVIQPEEMMLADLSILDEDVIDNTSKISISVPLQRSFTDIADSFTYQSESNLGTLSIKLDGSAEKLNTYTSQQEKLRFFPLEITISYTNYDYINSCGLQAVVNGNMHCRIQGTVNRETDVIEGIGSCKTGTEGMTGTLLYQLSENEFHDILIQSTVRLDGPWYDLTSYQFYGTYMLDRRSGTIDSVIAKPPQICEEY